MILKFHNYDGCNAPVVKANAEGYYIAGRTLLITGDYMHSRVGFSLIHHSIECFVKAFLLKESVHFDWSHNIEYLMTLATENSNIGVMFTDILNRKDIVDFLKELQSNYTKIKYGEKEFLSNKEKIIDIFDYLVQTFVHKFHELYGNPKKELCIWVPEELLDIMERERKYPITLGIIPKDYPRF